MSMGFRQYELPSLLLVFWRRTSPLPTPTTAAPVECRFHTPPAPLHLAMFTRQTFWLSTLRHFARSSFAVVIGVALATAVISGALIVGDSVRGSLERLSLERLGGVDHVVRGPRFFRQELAAELAEAWKADIATVAPAILVTGSVQTGQITSATSRRAGHVEVYGVDAAFWKLAGVDPPGEGLAVSRRLAEQLELKVGGGVAQTSLWMSGLQSLSIPLVPSSPRRSKQRPGHPARKTSVPGFHRIPLGIQMSGDYYFH